jgi:hypothetical protein
MKRSQLSLYISIFAIALTLSFGNAQAQETQRRYVIVPADTLVEFAPPGWLTIFDIYQKNISTDTLQFAWILVSKDIPNGWDYSMCDLGHCYGLFPEEPSDMAPTEPNEQAFLGLNLYPKGVAGTAVVRIYVYDKEFPNAGDTLTWIVSSAPEANVHERGIASNLSASPNPFIGRTSVTLDEGTSKLIVTNTLGVVVKRLDVKAQARGVELDLSSLPSGQYFLHSTLRDGKLGRPFKLLKQ